MKHLMSSVAPLAVYSVAMAKSGYARMDATTDSDAGQKLDKILAHMDKVSERLDRMDSRLDSVETKAGEAKEAAEKADSARRKDEEEKRYDSECMDKYSSRKDGDDDAAYKARHDAEEEAETKERVGKGEPKEVAADKAKKHRKDAEAKEAKEAEVKSKADSAFTTAAGTAARIAEIEKRIPMDASHQDFQALLGAQAKAADVFRLFGDSEPRPLNGEDLMGYRRRVAEKLKANSPAWKAVDLLRIDGQAFDVAETQIYADSVEVAKQPSAVADGELREIRRTTPSGHIETTFVGHPSAWMNNFSQSPRYVTSIQQPKAA